jgi:hypothetical protein
MVNCQTTLDEQRQFYHTLTVLTRKLMFIIAGKRTLRSPGGIV